jgi:UDP-glucose 4-epimerase
MRALVTGGAGFIGSHLVDALVARGDEVTVVDDLSTGRREFLNPAAHLVEHDIREPFDVGADAVVHLAAQAAGARLVFSSTGGAIYGDVDGPAAEDAPLRPVSPYGMAKLAAEAYVQGWNRVHGTQHVVLRFANVYGPRQSATLEGGVIAIFLERLAAGEEALIFGDGEQTRDFVHVDDVVRALLRASTRDGGVFNVGTGVETAVNRLHALCCEAVGVDAPARHDPPRLGDARRSVLDVTRAARELDWHPEVELAGGLFSTWSATTGKE